MIDNKRVEYMLVNRNIDYNFVLLNESKSVYTGCT
jgi:hypothetical protein